MRCSGVEGSAAAQRLAAFATQMRPVLAERAIADYDEIAAASALLAGLDLHGWIITGEAKFTQQAIVQKPIARGGDAVLTAKADQPTLVDDIATLFSDPQAVAAAITTRRTDLHGSRIEVRDLRASSALSAKYCGWAGLRQVLRIERRRINKRTGARDQRALQHLQLSATKRAKRLAAILHGHWGIENRLHWVRNVILGEDASRIRTGHASQVLAALRNVAVSLLGLLGCDSPSEGLRHFAWNHLDAI